MKILVPHRHTEPSTLGRFRLGSLKLSCDCIVCGKGFLPEDFVTILKIGPGNCPVQRARADAGQQFLSTANYAHHACVHGSGQVLPYVHSDAAPAEVAALVENWMADLPPDITSAKSYDLAALVHYAGTNLSPEIANGLYSMVFSFMLVTMEAVKSGKLATLAIMRSELKKSLDASRHQTTAIRHASGGDSVSG